ncbi:hypothetical protein LR48_Vigan05g077100 [Vigna angularis]|uniref:DUF4218 domain-containing protein n=1 Tax=Phaseolus angularis TaxID=3914 RepID=A0A0L9UKR9_PHAAN|nr:hypothetical protein LR48_Vigan05g077100 [Vigna angularis]
MKSHDCHVFMECLLPIAFSSLPAHVLNPITEISHFFRDLCSTTLNKDDLAKMEENIPIILCKMERIFPPSFFDSMEHLPIHLPYEARLGGPVHYRWMYPFERFYPTKTASKAITATIKQQFDEPWLTWGSIPKSTRDVFFERFKSQELGRSVHVDEIFQQTHIRQSTGEFVDERSRRTHEQFVAKFSQIRSETASVGVSASSSLDPTEEERLRNRCWLEAAGGRYKGRVYGIGNVSSQDDCVDSYIQQTQASSSAQQQNLEEIVNLKSQLQQYGQQLQKFEGFIGVLMPFLPPSAAAAAQDFLNLQNPQLQNEVPNDVQPEQQPPEQQPPPQQPTDEQPDDGNDYMHY